MVKLQSIILALFLFVSLFSISTSSASAFSADKTIEGPSSQTLTPIRLQLNWHHQFEFAGFYAAIEQGFYKAAGLEVSLHEFTAGIDPVDEVASGRAEYGVGDSSLIINRNRGQPVVLLTNIMQHSPMSLLTLADSGITSPAQMVGKRLMMAPHEVNNASIVAMLDRESVSLDQLELVEHNLSVDDLIDGRVDIISAYATNEPGVLRQKKIPVNIIQPINYGVDFYGNNIYTTEQEIGEQPERVRRFVEASLQGWVYALQHPERIIDLILQQYSTRKSREALQFEAKALNNYILSEHIPLGSVDELRMRHHVDVYRRLGLLKGDFALDDFIYKGLKGWAEDPVFSLQEQEWIRQHPVITLGVDPNWAPFEFIDDKAGYSGMAADFMRLIGQKSGLQIEVQDNASWKDVMDSARNRRLDVLPAVMRSPQREQFLDFTTPHITYPMVILTNKDSRFISALDDLKGEKVVVVDGYVTEDILRNNHPGLQLMTAQSIDQAIDMVSSGEAMAFVDNLASISRAVSKRGNTNLRISGTTRYDFALSIAVPKGNDMLLGIMQKALNSLTEEDVQQIKKRWISVSYTREVDYTLLIQIVLAGLMLLVFSLLWNHKLSSEIKSRKLAEDRANQSEQRFRLLFEDNKAVQLIVDPDQLLIIEANKAASSFYGYTHDELCGMSVTAINILSTDEIAEELVKAKNELRTQFHFRHRLASGDIRDVDVHTGPVQWDGKRVLYSIIHDVTIQNRLHRELAEKTERLSFQASHDALTGLINRREFEARLSKALSYCDNRATDCNRILVFMDLDNFKIVNDTAGHAAGDELLRRVSQLMQAQVRERDTLARLGGDEFGLLLQNCSIEQAVGIVVNIIQTVKEMQFIWKDASFRIGVSMGLTEISGGPETLDDVMSEADAACYAAKKRGRNCYHIFSQKNEELMRRKGEMWWTNEIMRATEEDRLVLFYQEITPMSAEQENGGRHYEILIRMRDSDGGLVLPGSFLPSAERYKLMPMIDSWVISAVFAFFRDNPQAVDELQMCNVNLSGHSLSDKAFMALLLQSLQAANVPASKLCWEVTETAAITNFNEAQAFIDMVRELGCSFALDDFGSGLSSFNYLKHLQVDYLKIDGSFVKDMLTDPKDYLIVESIYRVGRGMQMRTIAEFVESEEIYQQLKKIGVDYAQGFHLHSPQPLV